MINKKRKKNEPPTMYIKHLAESAIFEVITVKNIFSYYETSMIKIIINHT